MLVTAGPTVGAASSRGVFNFHRQLSSLDADCILAIPLPDTEADREYAELYPFYLCQVKDYDAEKRQLTAYYFERHTLPDEEWWNAAKYGGDETKLTFEDKLAQTQDWNWQNMDWLDDIGHDVTIEVSPQTVHCWGASKGMFLLCAYASIRV
jgi:hypothetical protein